MVRMPRILVVDNYDSFVYNLVQYLGQLGVECDVRRNDEIELAEVGRLTPAGVLLSPGPSTPQRAGICMSLISEYAGKLPIFGVCLGHQAIGAVFGGRVVRAPAPVHGKTAVIEHDGRGLFAGLTGAFAAGRYHSLVVADEGLPAELEISARTREDGIIMGLRHRTRPIHGVQFHPESVLTGEGRKILRNFLEL